VRRLHRLVRGRCTETIAGFSGDRTREATEAPPGPRSPPQARPGHAADGRIAFRTGETLVTFVSQEEQA
jgi:hypothetical protein